MGHFLDFVDLFCRLVSEIWENSETFHEFKDSFTIIFFLDFSISCPRMIHFPLSLCARISSVCHSYVVLPWTVQKCQVEFGNSMSSNSLRSFIWKCFAKKRSKIMRTDLSFFFPGILLKIKLFSEREQNISFTDFTFSCFF